MKKLMFALPAVLLLTACGDYSLQEVEALRADKAARAFAVSAGTTSIGCSGQDSNSDNYVTCTIKDGAGQLIEITCSYSSAEAGCKLKKS